MPLRTFQRRVLQEGLLVFAGLFAIVWAVVRASVQSITLDEADTYFWFVSRAASYIWYPFPNNHVLNSLLMWIATRVFGNSIVAVRAPALLGAVIYIFCCYFLCRSITDHFSLRLPLFICLTYNPFIFDFMVAARGYSLADAFWVAAITVPVWHRVRGGLSLRTSCILASVALGLSFTANFSFAFVDGATYLAILVWAARRREGESAVRLLGFCTLPGLFVALLICGYPLTHWPKGQLWWGAHSFGEMVQSLVQSSLYQLDPRSRESGWYIVINFLAPLLLPVLGVLCFCQVVSTRLDGSWLQDAQSRWLGRFAAALTGIAALAILMHGLAFRFDNLPLPMGRTGIFLVPLCTLVAGIIAAGPARSVVSRWLRQGITALFICVACYFLLCLRLTYFKEYEVDADVKDVYSVLAGFNHTYGIRDVTIGGSYASSLDYYRVLSNKETFPPFVMATHPPPAGKPIYVLHGPFESEFIKKERLAIIYRGKSTDIVVAVRPGGVIPATVSEP